MWHQQLPLPLSLSYLLNVAFCLNDIVFQLISRRQFLLRYVDAAASATSAAVAGTMSTNERFRSGGRREHSRAGTQAQAHRQGDTMAENNNNIIKSAAKASVILNMRRNSRIMSTRTNTREDLLEIRASALMVDRASSSQLDRKSVSKSAKSAMSRSNFLTH